MIRVHALSMYHDHVLLSVVRLQLWPPYYRHLADR